MNGHRWLLLTAVSGFLAVALGAFGAHGLKDTGYLERKYAEIPPKNLAGHTVPAAFKYLRDFETGVDYHLTHTAALGITAILMMHRRSRWLAPAAWSFLLGTALFSGSLYVLVIGGPKWAGIPWGMIAPIGGTLLLAGWGCLAAAALTLHDSASSHSRS